MHVVPIPIKERISNAHYYLECADKFPPPTKNAAHILLLLASWENIIIADEELSAWIDKKKVDPKLYRDHVHKFRKAPSIQHIILGSRDIPAKTIEYSSPKDINKLREYCQYGFVSGSKSVSKFFGRTWNTDDFRNKLINKIQWTGALVSAIEALPD